MGKCALIAYELLEEPRVLELRKRPVDFLIATVAYMRIHQCGGEYPVLGLRYEFGMKEIWDRRIQRVLTQYGVFIVVNGMIGLQPGLSTKCFLARTYGREDFRETGEAEDYAGE